MNKELAPSLAPAGKLRIGLNYSNFLIVSGDESNGDPRGIAPDLGRELAKRAGLPFEFVKFDAAGKLFDAVKAGEVDVGFLGNEPQRAIIDPARRWLGRCRELGCAAAHRRRVDRSRRSGWTRPARGAS